MTLPLQGKINNGIKMLIKSGKEHRDIFNEPEINLVSAQIFLKDLTETIVHTTDSSILDLCYFMLNEITEISLDNYGLWYPQGIGNYIEASWQALAANKNISHRLFASLLKIVVYDRHPFSVQNEITDCLMHNINLDYVL